MAASGDESAANPVGQSGRRALVLSGGGAKGSFTAGAIDYLFTRASYFPDIITGTSIGSICAGVIAQARTPEEFRAVAPTLRGTVIAMGTPGVAVEAQSWIQELSATRSGAKVADYVAGQMRPPPPPPDTDMDVDVLANPPTAVSHSKYNLMSVLGSAAMHPHILREMRANDTAIMKFEPFAAALSGETPGSPIQPIDTDAVAKPGLQLRLTVTALNDACIRYVDQTGAIVERDGHTPAPGAPVPGVIEGMLASASVPTVFAPRRLGDDVYVDGGMVQNIPLAPALDLDPDEVVVVLSEQRLCPPADQDYSTADALTILYRAQSDVGFFDQQRRDLEAATSVGVPVRIIEPIVDVVGAFDRSAERMEINADYGWLRASAQMAGLSDTDLAKANDASDQITAARVRLLHFASGEGSLHPQFEASVGSARKQIAEGLQVFTDTNLEVPAGAGEWPKLAVRIS